MHTTALVFQPRHTSLFFGIAVTLKDLKLKKSPGNSFRFKTRFCYLPVLKSSTEAVATEFVMHVVLLLWFFLFGNTDCHFSCSCPQMIKVFAPLLMRLE